MFGKFEEAYLKVLKECDETSAAPATECDNKKPVTECGDGEQVATETAKDNPRKVVTFFTEDPSLIDALNNGFESVVLTVKTVDDDGEESTEEVTFGPEVFEEIAVEDAPVDDDEAAATDGDEEFDESITGAAGGAIAGGMVGGPLGAVAGGLLGSNL